MKKFDLELAKAGHLVCTLDGKPVRIICFDLKDTKYPIVAVVMNGDVETVNQYTNEGEYFGDGLESYNDLMMVSEVEESDIKEAIKYAIAASTHEDGILLNGVTESEAIAWLEKQGDIDRRIQEEIEKQTKQQWKAEKQGEPKFHVGDWIICCGYVKTQIIDITTNMYKMSNGDMRPFNMVDDNHSIRLWTIQDAKDGDVLSNGKMIVIFKHFEDPSYRQHIVAYVGLDTNGDIQITDNTWNLGIDKAKPATKEQRDLLFSKMKEAGYEWDDEKKELKKIEQKPAWSEEDENKVTLFMQLTEGCNNEEKLADWLKSLKDRVQPQQEYSEDDIRAIDRACVALRAYSNGELPNFLPSELLGYADKLQSLIPQNRWKPTEEQIQALEYQVHSTYKGSWQYRASKELLEQLKKLLL